MVNTNTFETMLTGGHRNSLGQTVEVVNVVLKNKARLDDLYQCYFSEDEVVRLRVSNAIKRICQEHPDWLVPYLDRFIAKVSTINQASTQWTLAQLFLCLDSMMTDRQKNKATIIMKKNLQTSDDWIVQNQTMATLGLWATKDTDLKNWLEPQLKKLSTSYRKSVASRAKKILKTLDSNH